MALYSWKIYHMQIEPQLDCSSDSWTSSYYSVHSMVRRISSQDEQSEILCSITINQTFIYHVRARISLQDQIKTAQPWQLTPKPCHKWRSLVLKKTNCAYNLLACITVIHKVEKERVETMGFRGIFQNKPSQDWELGEGGGSMNLCQSWVWVNEQPRNRHHSPPLEWVDAILLLFEV